MAGQVMLARPRALADPDGAGPQDAAEFASAGQVGPVARAQRKKLMVILAWGTVRRRREPVIGIGPPERLLRVGSRRLELAG
jgi:hypothetical protein